MTSGSEQKSNLLAALLLMLVYCFAYIDRSIFSILVAPIKAQFALTDIEIGYFLGPAFILTYMTCGLPAGWCVDRFNRRNLILGAGICWSAATIAAAVAQSYGALFASRLLVGASEALIYPAGLSLVADLFDRRQLPIATSIFLLASPLGSALSLMAGGALLGAFDKAMPLRLPLLGAMQGWQATVVTIGGLGLLPVLLMTLMRDPSRHHGQATGVSSERQFGFVEGTLFLARRGRFYIAFILGMACSSLTMLTIAAWAPTYLTRSFGLTPAEVGARYGTLVLIFGLAGSFAGPFANFWMTRRGAQDSSMRTVVLGQFLLVAFAIAFLFARSETVALACLALLTFSNYFPLSMASTSLQLACPARLRGAASAWYFVTVALMGYGVGPTIVPYIAAKLLHDPARIGEAMAAVLLIFGLLASILCQIALGGFRTEIAAGSTASS